MTIATSCRNTWKKTLSDHGSCEIRILSEWIVSSVCDGFFCSSWWIGESPRKITNPVDREIHRQKHRWKGRTAEFLPCCYAKGGVLYPLSRIKHPFVPKCSQCFWSILVKSSFLGGHMWPNLSHLAEIEQDYNDIVNDIVKAVKVSQADKFGSESSGIVTQTVTIIWVMTCLAAQTQLLTSLLRVGSVRATSSSGRSQIFFQPWKFRAGWCWATPLKIWKSMGLLFPIYGENNPNVPNHQPVREQGDTSHEYKVLPQPKAKMPKMPSNSRISSWAFVTASGYIGYG